MADGTRAVFIDSVSALVPCRHDCTIGTGERGDFDADGGYHLVRRNPRSVPGPYGNTIAVSSVGDQPPYKYLLVEGSPLKFLQGHNLFGPCDLTRLLITVAERVVDYFGLSPTADDIAAWEAGRVKLRRLDCTAMMGLGSRTAVDQAIEILKTGKHKFLRAAALDEHSVRHGLGSKHYSFLIYGKGQEIEANGHEIPMMVPFRQELIDWANDQIRFEVSFKGRKLRSIGGEYAHSWTPERVEAVIREQIANIRVNGEQQLTGDALEGLSGQARSLFYCWRGRRESKKE